MLSGNPKPGILARVCATIGALVVAVAVLFARPIEGAAQERRPLSLEANGGNSFGYTSGEHLGNEVGVAADVLLAVRTLPRLLKGSVVGMNAGVHGSGPYDTVCKPTTTGGCVPAFPTFGSVAQPFNTHVS